MKINNKQGYVRISFQSQESKNSIESQKEQLIKNRIKEDNTFIKVVYRFNNTKNNLLLKN